MNTEQMIRLYRKRAKNYNWTANLYYLIGFREWRQRKEAVRSLEFTGRRHRCGDRLWYRTQLRVAS